MDSQPTNRTQEQLKSLFEHYRNGRLDDAENLARSITKEVPSNGVAWKALWGILQKTGKTKESLTAIQKAAQISPSDAKVCYSLGYTLLKLGKLSEAEVTLKKVVACKPDYAEAYHYLGVTRQKLGKLEEAEKTYLKAIALKPNYSKAHFNLGNTLKNLGRLEKAEKSYTQAIDFNPDFYLAHYNLAQILYKQERLKEAESSYRKVIALKPGVAEAYCELGVTLQELGRLHEAEESYRQAIALKPNNAQAHYYFGVTLKRMGRLEESEASYKKAIALEPDYAEVHYNLGATQQRLGKFGEAEASYKKAIKLNPDYRIVKHRLAALTGKTTETAPREYVEELFDSYASKFESHLVDNLDYRVPSVLTEIMIKDSKSDFLGSITDLGCGTGLFGIEINQFCGHLEGVDLSEKMLEKAKEKNVYNKLVRQDIIDYLSNANLNFDYFISTDVFNYIGDLSDVFRLIKSRNETGGKLAFSTEHCAGEGFFLEKSGRYSHSKTYVESLCETFGYKVSHFETQNLRKAKSQYLEGGLYILDF